MKKSGTPKERFESVEVVAEQPTVEQKKRKRTAAISESLVLDEEAEQQVRAIKKRIKKTPRPVKPLPEVEVSTLPQEAEKKPGIVKRLWKNRFARMILVAAGLHAPLTPQLGPLFFGDHTKELQKKDRWHDKNAVLRPQSDEARERVENLQSDRLKRVDRKGIAEFKNQVRSRIEQGENVSFMEMYFQLELLNGVDPERVAQAKAAAQAEISRFIEMVGDDLTEDEIREIVQSMYGGNENYDWGQASVTEYFLSSKRNCIAASAGELIVFEGVIRSLPEEEQEKFHLGKLKVQQHDIATLHVSDEAGGRTYRLEPPTAMIPDGTNEAGTVDIPQETLKQGLIADAEHPVHVRANAAERGEEVEDSPRIDAVTNQPVSDGIAVEGKLRGSDYVRNMAKKQNIQPMDSEEYRKKHGIMELTFLEDQKGDPGVEEAAQRVKAAHDAMQGWPTFDHPFTLDARDFTNPSKESVERLANGIDSHAPFRMSEVIYPDLSQWSDEAIKELLETNADVLHISTDAKGRLTTQFLNKLEERIHEANTTHLPGRERLAWGRLMIESPKVSPRASDTFNIPQDQLARLWKILSSYHLANELELGFSTHEIRPAEAKLIASGGFSSVYLEDSFHPGQYAAETTPIIRDGNQVVSMAGPGYSYFRMSGLGRKDPTLKNFILDVRHTETAQLQQFLKMLLTVETDLRDVRLTAAIGEELDRRANPGRPGGGQPQPPIYSGD